MSVLTQSDDHHDVGRVLTQSDLANVWKASLPQEGYQAKLVDYIQKTYRRAEGEWLHQEQMKDGALGELEK
ncbi:MAG: hypothetical protein ACRDEA_15100 [Microcystaceae cyanobacterium]